MVELKENSDKDVKVSKIIRACVDKNYIKQDESKRYIPNWA